MTTSEQQPDQTGRALDLVVTYSRQLEEYNRKALERVRQALPAAALELRAAGVARIEVHYDGCGDSGQIDDIYYYAADDTAVDPSGKASLSDSGLKDLFYDLLEVRHGGWENNDGACGEFHWNLHEDTLRHTHNERYTDYSTTEHDGI